MAKCIAPGYPAEARRRVAIKVLPDGVAADPERLARFHRKAQLLASLIIPTSPPSTASKNLVAAGL